MYQTRLTCLQSAQIRLMSYTFTLLFPSTHLTCLLTRFTSLPGFLSLGLAPSVHYTLGTLGFLKKFIDQIGYFVKLVVGSEEGEVTYHGAKALAIKLKDVLDQESDEALY